jgi:hypothetical protein
MKAEMKADQAKANQEDLLAKMEVKQAEMNANTKAIQERMEADRKSNREDLKGMMEEMMNANQTEMSCTACAIQSELETIQLEIRAVIQPIWSELDEMTACNEAPETEPDPGMMQPVAEHQENPKGEAAVMPTREPRKRRRIRNLAAESRQKMKERTQGYCGSRRKLAAASRKVSSRATVARRKRNLLRRIGTQENCGPRKKLYAAGMRKGPKCKNGIRDRGLKRQQ